jgi:hypothetical protein
MAANRSQLLLSMGIEPTLAANITDSGRQRTCTVLMFDPERNLVSMGSRDPETPGLRRYDGERCSVETGVGFNGFDQLPYY